MADQQPRVPIATGEPYVSLDDHVGHLLRRAHQRSTAIFQKVIGDDQITPTQYAALLRLEEQNELSQNHLGRLTAMDPATTQGVIRRLLERHLIAARADPHDRRRTLLSLTDSGRQLLARTAPNSPAVADAILAPLAPEERGAFIDLLRRLA